MRVFSSNKSASLLEDEYRLKRQATERNSNVAFIGFYTNDLESAILEQEEITDEIITYVKGAKKENVVTTECIKPKPSKVFIVHGHDDALKNEVARFIERLKLEPIILHEQPNSGDTIIEKIDRNTDVGFGVVLSAVAVKPPTSGGGYNKRCSQFCVELCQ